MKNKQLIEKLARLGYPLLEVEDFLDVNKTLAEVVKSKNVRFLEGFPVMLANACKEYSFDYSKVVALLGNKEAKEALEDLFLMSFALYKVNNIYFDWVKVYEGQLTHMEKAKVKSFSSSLKIGILVKVGSFQLSVERVKKVFQDYLAGESKVVKNFNKKHDEMSLEFALSQVFSPKQKELFKKRFKGEVLTKTEREYFSRTVKKRIAALANSELHHLAQKVLQN